MRMPRTTSSCRTVQATKLIVSTLALLTLIAILPITHAIIITFNITKFILTHEVSPYDYWHSGYDFTILVKKTFIHYRYVDINDNIIYIIKRNKLLTIYYNPVDQLLTVTVKSYKLKTSKCIKTFLVGINTNTLKVMRNITLTVCFVVGHTSTQDIIQVHLPTLTVRKIRLINYTVKKLDFANKMFIVFEGEKYKSATSIAKYKLNILTGKVDYTYVSHIFAQINERYVIMSPYSIPAGIQYLYFYVYDLQTNKIVKEYELYLGIWWYGFYIEPIRIDGKLFYILFLAEGPAIGEVEGLKNWFPYAVYIVENSQLHLILKGNARHPTFIIPVYSVVKHKWYFLAYDYYDLNATLYTLSYSPQIVKRFRNAKRGYITDILIPLGDYGAWAPYAKFNFYVIINKSYINTLFILTDTDALASLSSHYVLFLANGSIPMVIYKLYTNVTIGKIVPIGGVIAETVECDTIFNCYHKLAKDIYFKFALSVSGLLNVSRLVGVVDHVGSVLFNISGLVPQLLVLNPGLVNGLPLSEWNRTWWVRIGWWSVASGVDHMRVRALAVGWNSTEIIGSWHVVFGKRPWSFRTDVALVMGVTVPLRKIVSLGDVYRLRLLILAGYGFSSVTYNPISHEIGAILTDIVPGGTWLAHLLVSHFPIIKSSMVKVMQILENDTASLPKIPEKLIVKVRRVALPNGEGVEYIINTTVLFLPRNGTARTSQLPLPKGIKLPRFVSPRQAVEWALRQNPTILEWLMREKFNLLWGRWLYDFCLPRGISQDQCWGMFLDWWYRGGWQEAYEMIVRELEPTLGMALYRLSARTTISAIKIVARVFIKYIPYIARGVLIGFFIVEGFSWLFVHPGLYTNNILGISLNVQTLGAYPSLVGLVTTQGKFPTWWRTLPSPDVRQYLWEIATGAPLVAEMPVALLKKSTLTLANGQVAMYVAYVPKSPIAIALEKLGRSLDDSYLTEVSFYVFRLVEFRYSFFQAWANAWGLTPQAWFSAWIYPYKIMIAVEKKPIKGAQEIAKVIEREANIHKIPITIISTGKKSLLFKIVFPKPTKALPKWIANIFKGWLLKGTITFYVEKDFVSYTYTFPSNLTVIKFEFLTFKYPNLVLLITNKGTLVLYVGKMLRKFLKYSPLLINYVVNTTSIQKASGIVRLLELIPDVGVWAYNVPKRIYLGIATTYGLRLINNIINNASYVKVLIWYKLPPDVGVGGVLFNGTEITSTVPHVATVVLFATVPESFVVLKVCAGGGYWTASGRYMDLGTFMCWNFTLRNVTAGVNLINVPIGKVVEEYYRKVQAVGMNGTYRMWVWVKAWIVNASRDEISADNFAMNNCTFPVPYWKGNVTVLVHVLDAYTLRPIPRFYVWAMSIKYLKNITGTWGTNGRAVLYLRYGVKYMVCAWACGYYRKCVQVMPLGSNWTVTILLYPRNRTVPTSQVVTPPAQGYATVLVHVMYEDGVPFQGAEVTILQNGAVVCSGHTDVRGVFMCHVKNMTATTIRVIAKVDGVTYRYEKTIVPKTFTVLYFTVPVLSPTSTLGASAMLVVKVYDSYSGKPLPNVTVILNGTLRAVTNASGIAVFKNLHVCNRANITVEAPSNYLNLVGYETVHIARRVTLLNYPLCPTAHKPSAVTYVVTLVVRDRLGNPVAGALVKVLNAVSKSLIAEGYTTSSGLFRFVVPNDTLVDILVRYGNVTLWINNTLVTKPLVLKIRLPVVAKVAKPPRYLQARIVVTALNMTSLEPVKNAVVTVVSLYRGYTYSNVTNSSGMAVFTVQRWHYYTISAVAGRYETPHGFVAYTCYRECRVWLPLEPTGVEYMYYGNGSAVLPMYRIGNVTYVPIIVQVSYRDGAPVQGLAVQYNATYDNASIVKTFVTDCLGRTYITVPFGSNVTIIIRNSSKTLWVIRLVRVNESLWIVKHLNVTSPWYRPEVAILSISVSKPRVDTVRMVPYVPYRLELWTNMPQRVKVRVCLIAVKTNSTITCKTLRLVLGRGLNVYYGSLYYVVTEPTPAHAVATIVYAENDTYRWNNVAYSREVVLTPYIDLALAVLVNVTRSPLPLIPIPQYSTLKITAIVSLHGKASKLTNTTLRLAVLCQLPWGAWTVYKNYTLAITHAPYVLNITLPTPWCINVKVVGSLSYPYDINPLNNNATASLSIAPEVELVSARPSPRLPTYPSNMPFKIIIVVKTNDYNVPLFVQVKDTTTGKILTFLNYTLLQNTTTYTFAVPVKVSAGLFAVAESHTLNITIASPADTLHSNNYRAISITVTGMAVTIAGIFIGLLLLIILLLIILIIVVLIARRRRIRARTVGEYGGYV